MEANRLMVCVSERSSAQPQQVCQFHSPQNGIVDHLLPRKGHSRPCLQQKATADSLRHCGSTAGVPPRALNTHTYAHTHTHTQPRSSNFFALDKKVSKFSTALESSTLEHKHARELLGWPQSRSHVRGAVACGRGSCSDTRGRLNTRGCK